LRTTNPAVQGEQLRTLADREVQVLNHVVDGLSCREIAHEFGVSLATVVSQRASIMAKLEVNSAQSLIGLVSRFRYAQQSRSPIGLTTATRQV
jgi:FixJ family two-component response regulator